MIHCIALCSVFTLMSSFYHLKLISIWCEVNRIIIISWLVLYHYFVNSDSALENNSVHSNRMHWLISDESSGNTVCLLAKGASKPKADFSLIVSFAPTLSLPLQIGQYFESGILFISPGQSATEERVWARRRQSEKNQLWVCLHP